MHCLEYGHKISQCRAKEWSCPRSAGKHKYEECTVNKEINVNKKCKHCNGHHSVSYKGCPHFKTVKKALKTVAVTRFNDNKISYKEALLQAKQANADIYHKDEYTTSGRQIYTNLNLGPTNRTNTELDNIPIDNNRNIPISNSYAETNIRRQCITLEPVLEQSYGNVIMPAPNSSGPIAYSGRNPQYDNRYTQSKSNLFPMPNNNTDCNYLPVAPFIDFFLKHLHYLFEQSHDVKHIINHTIHLLKQTLPLTEDQIITLNNHLK